jgi:hypothetical protein
MLLAVPGPLFGAVTWPQAAGNAANLMDGSGMQQAREPALMKPGEAVRNREVGT